MCSSVPKTQFRVPKLRTYYPMPKMCYLMQKLVIQCQKIVIQCRKRETSANSLLCLQRMCNYLSGVLLLRQVFSSEYQFSSADCFISAIQSVLWSFQDNILNFTFCSSFKAPELQALMWLTHQFSRQNGPKMYKMNHILKHS